MCRANRNSPQSVAILPMAIPMAALPVDLRKRLEDLSQASDVCIIPGRISTENHLSASGSRTGQVEHDPQLQ